MNTSKILVLAIPLLLLGCTVEDEDSTALEGTWQSEEFASSGQLSDIIYHFDGNNFNELISLKNSDGKYTLTENKGTLEILDETITTESGLTAYQINLTYDRDSNPLVKQIAYISDKALFLGNTKEVTDESEKQSCQGDTYSTKTTDIEIVNGAVVSFEEVTKCFLRPSTLNLSFPYNHQSN